MISHSIETNQRATVPPSAADAAAVLVSAVERRNSPALGTELASTLRSVFPDVRWEDFGAVSLRDFIAKHALTLAEVGRQGGDLLYGPRKLAPGGSSTAVPTSLKTRTASENVWRSFSSPNSSRIVAIQVNSETGGWRLVESGTSDSGDWQTVVPLSGEEHLTIARDFVETVLEPSIRQMAATAVEGGGAWWLRLREALRMSRDEELRYRRFRTAGIAAALRTRLESLGISDSARDVAIRRAAPEFVHGDSVQAASRRPSPAAASAAASRLASAEDVRSLAAALINVLPEEELRGIRVRLGDVLDALRGR